MLFAVLACADLTTPDQALDGALSAALPARTRLVVGLDREAAVAAGLPGLSALEELEAELGLSPGAARQVRIGCGADGCVVLAEGAFSGLVLPERLAWRDVSVGLKLHDRGWDSEPGALGRFALRRVGDRKVVAGDRAAVAEVLNAGGGFDVSGFAGAVAAGPAWALLVEPEAFLEDAADRANSAGLPGETQLRAAVEALPIAPEHIESVGLTWREATLVLRVHARSEAHALLVATALRAAEPVTQLTQDGRWVEAHAPAEALP